MGTLQPGVPYTDSDADDVTTMVAGDRTAEAFTGAYCEIRSTVSQAIPNNTWTPVAFPTIDRNLGNFLTAPTATTTIAAGSNGAVLAQATINVASNSGFPTSGYLLITGPPGVGVNTIVAYTGKGTNSFTGCTLGTGTLATGNVVAAVLVGPDIVASGIFVHEFSATFAANATGYRGARWMLAGLFPYGSETKPAVATAAATSDVRSSTTNSTVAPGPLSLVPQVFQNSGGVLNITANAVSTPRCTVRYAGAIT